MAFPNADANPSTYLPVWTADGPAYSTALGYAQVTSLATAVGLPTVPAGAVVALIIVEGAPVRWRDDGTAPTATVGNPIGVGTVMYYWIDLGAVQFIEESAGGILNITYYR